MMDRPLLISGILENAVQNFPDQEIVTRTVEGPIHRYTYKDANARIRKLANALKAAGVKRGDRVGVIGWNTHRQFELYYALGGVGAVCHTINPRLGPENAGYVINHAGDSWLFFDTTFTPLVEGLAPHLKSVQRFVAMTDDQHLPEFKAGEIVSYESFIAGASEEIRWEEFDENTASGLCYTSGTTGVPKGVLYSHRSTILQSYAANLPTALNMQVGECVLPVVPMFHVNAWNVPYACLMIGAKMVFPGPGLDGESLATLMEEEKVEFSLGVPTVWLGLLQHLDGAGKTLKHMKKTLVGGSALPEKIVRGFKKHGVEVMQGWGMTEMSPLGTTMALTPVERALSEDEQIAVSLKQGRAISGVEMRLVDAEGRVLPHDGEHEGHLQVRGPWIVKEYYNHDQDILTTDGWFDTGDVATIDRTGIMQITDRAKDVIKSGGEWVSSIDIENAAMSHEGVAQAAVIAAKHPKWDERPLLLIVRAAGSEVTGDEVKSYVAERLPKIAWPDAVEFIDELPLGATGKVLKTKLRDQFKDYQLAS
ncbi:MAG: long-chain-fatty-acid--CoA ligase [Pseudomonadota bacterium]